MPQKKNPDVPELVRGKSGRVVGHLVSLLVLMKGQPLAYNKDNQEDKEPLFDSIDTLSAVCKAFADMLPNLQFKRENLRIAANRGFATATDLADYLVRKKLPFRDAHEVVGRLVKHAIDHQQTLSDLSLEEMRSVSSQIDEDVYQVLSVDGSVNSKQVYGGASPASVRAQIIRVRAQL